MAKKFFSFPKDTHKVGGKSPMGKDFGGKKGGKRSGGKTPSGKGLIGKGSLGKGPMGKNFQFRGDKGPRIGYTEGVSGKSNAPFAQNFRRDRGPRPNYTEGTSGKSKAPFAQNFRKDRGPRPSYTEGASGKSNAPFAQNFRKDRGPRPNYTEGTSGKSNAPFARNSYKKSALGRFSLGSPMQGANPSPFVHKSSAKPLWKQQDRSQKFEGGGFNRKRTLSLAKGIGPWGAEKGSSHKGESFYRGKEVDQNRAGDQKTSSKPKHPKPKHSFSAFSSKKESLRKKFPGPRDLIAGFSPKKSDFSSKKKIEKQPPPRSSTPRKVTFWAGAEFPPVKSDEKGEGAAEDEPPSSGLQTLSLRAANRGAEEPILLSTPQKGEEPRPLNTPGPVAEPVGSPLQDVLNPEALQQVVPIETSSSEEGSGQEVMPQLTPSKSAASGDNPTPLIFPEFQQKASDQTPKQQSVVQQIPSAEKVENLLSGPLSELFCKFLSRSAELEGRELGKVEELGKHPPETPMTYVSNLLKMLPGWNASGDKGYPGEGLDDVVRHLNFSVPGQSLDEQLGMFLQNMGCEEQHLSSEPEKNGEAAPGVPGLSSAHDKCQAQGLNSGNSFQKTQENYLQNPQNLQNLDQDTGSFYHSSAASKQPESPSQDLDSSMGNASKQWREISQGNSFTESDKQTQSFNSSAGESGPLENQMLEMDLSKREELSFSKSKHAGSQVYNTQPPFKTPPQEHSFKNQSQRGSLLKVSSAKQSQKANKVSPAQLGAELDVLIRSIEKQVNEARNLCKKPEQFIPYYNLSTQNQGVTHAKKIQELMGNVGGRLRKMDATLGMARHYTGSQSLSKVENRIPKLADILSKLTLILDREDQAAPDKGVLTQEVLHTDKQKEKPMLLRKREGVSPKKRIENTQTYLQKVLEKFQDPSIEPSQKQGSGKSFPKGAQYPDGKVVPKISRHQQKPYSRQQ